MHATLLPLQLLTGVLLLLLLPLPVQSTYPDLTIERSIYWGAVTITTIGALPTSLAQHAACNAPSSVRCNVQVHEFICIMSTVVHHLQACASLQLSALARPAEMPACRDISTKRGVPISCC
jgi:hypothetical protein